MKLDLVKAYDKVEWDFLRLILLRIALSLEVIKWIMVCVPFVNFIVLVNESLIHFFQSNRGLRKACPLSPLLFFIVVEGLSLLVAKKRLEGLISRAKVSTNRVLSHPIFVDDMLHFGEGLIQEWDLF